MVEEISTLASIITIATMQSRKEVVVVTYKLPLLWVRRRNGFVLCDVNFEDETRKSWRLYLVVVEPLGSILDRISLILSHPNLRVGGPSWFHPEPGRQDSARLARSYRVFVS